MKDYFEKVFADILKRIANGELRRKTIAAWELAAVEGGWGKDDINKIPFTLLTETHGINLIEHTIAVTLGAAGLADSVLRSYERMPYDIDMDLLYAGGLLHDVGKLLEIEYRDGKYQKSHAGKCARHPISGAIIAARVGLPLEIINIVANHAKEGEGRPQRIETILIHQADFATFDPLVMKQKGLLIE
ncbi:MAG: HD domain-containing protein [Candidatus Cloacimonetes bacterium]|nr:HD domain-containing protein [Candidatus Cloacimonadota bacterium]